MKPTITKTKDKVAVVNLSTNAKIMVLSKKKVNVKVLA